MTAHHRLILKKGRAPAAGRCLMILAMLPKNSKIERIAPDALPANWRSLAAREEPHAIGPEWGKGGSTAVLAVPSAVIPA